MYRQIGQCLGVCSGEISSGDYRVKVIRPLRMFLSGKKSALIVHLRTRMKAAARARDFEEAGRLRDQIAALTHIHDIALLNTNFVHDVVPTNTKSIRVEGYDISNFGQADKVGSMVVFDERGPVKSQYRKFNIRSVSGQSDVDCLAEVIGRRLGHAEWGSPDVIMVDGGVPQVNAVKKILLDHGSTIPVVGIAKGPTRKNNEIILGDRSPQFSKWVYSHIKLLIQVRDEAHRFAIKFNRSKRKIV